MIRVPQVGIHPAMGDLIRARHHDGGMDVYQRPQGSVGPLFVVDRPLEGDNPAVLFGPDLHLHDMGMSLAV